MAHQMSPDDLRHEADNIAANAIKEILASTIGPLVGCITGTHGLVIEKSGTKTIINIQKV